MAAGYWHRILLPMSSCGEYKSTLELGESSQNRPPIVTSVYFFLGGGGRRSLNEFQVETRE
jgi:hypothetical protein